MLRHGHPLWGVGTAAQRRDPQQASCSLLSLPQLAGPQVELGLPPTQLCVHTWAHRLSGLPSGFSALVMSFSSAFSMWQPGGSQVPALLSTLPALHHLRMNPDPRAWPSGTSGWDPGQPCLWSPPAPTPPFCLSSVPFPERPACPQGREHLLRMGPGWLVPPPQRGSFGGVCPVGCGAATPTLDLSTSKVKATGVLRDRGGGSKEVTARACKRPSPD